MNPALPKNWHYVYLPRGNNTSWIYVGCTKDLEERLKEHNRGEVRSTKNVLPVELIYFEAYRSNEYAYQREKNLKAYGSSLAKLKSRLGIKKKGRAG